MINFLLRHPYRFSILFSAFFVLLFPVTTGVFKLWYSNQSISWNHILALYDGHDDLSMWGAVALILAFLGVFTGKISMWLKQKMESLEQRTVQLNTILDTVASAIITIDKTGTIISFNRSAERIFGYSPSEVIGCKINRLMPAVIAEQHDGYIRRFFDTQKAVIIGKRREVEAQRKNGEIFPALLQVSLLEMEDELFFTGMVDDISETKVLQAQLSQAQKLEAIGQLASGVAHEINTPIQYIGDNLSALYDNFNEIIAFQRNLDVLADESLKIKLDQLIERHDLQFILEDSPKAIEQALEGVERVAEIVKAMKSFSHVEASQTKQMINLPEALNDALTLSRNSYKYVADVETDFDPEMGSIECYAGELNQVFLNLIINAAHAIEEKKAGRGLIRIVTRKLNNNNVDILFTDNGAGIPKDIQEKVFNLFFTTKPVGKGTGQGLSLAHNIVVEKHHGRLFFESEVGIGTTFHIQLPLASKEST
jgi:two-component system NtrC family sensor kinase